MPFSSRLIETPILLILVLLLTCQIIAVPLSFKEINPFKPSFKNEISTINSLLIESSSSLSFADFYLQKSAKSVTVADMRKKVDIARKLTENAYFYTNRAEGILNKLEKDPKKPKFAEYAKEIGKLRREITH